MPPRTWGGQRVSVSCSAKESEGCDVLVIQIPDRSPHAKEGHIAAGRPNVAGDK